MVADGLLKTDVARSKELIDFCTAKAKKADAAIKGIVSELQTGDEEVVAVTISGSVSHNGDGADDIPFCTALDEQPDLIKIGKRALPATVIDITSYNRIIRYAGGVVIRSLAAHSVLTAQKDSRQDVATSE
jgi:hypothetical protein